LSGEEILNKKLKLSEIMLALLLIGTLTLAFNVQQVETPITDDGGFATVCIRADGSVDPLTAPIHRYGNTYTLYGNISCDVFSDGIVIERDDMILDGAGYTLQGISGSDLVDGAVSGRGITLWGRSNVTIKNITVKTFAWGINIVVSFNNSIVGNNITDIGIMGIWIDHSSNNTISRNNITNSSTGIHIHSSSNNVIYSNNFIDNPRQVDATTPSYANFWSVYPSGGNYWSDYVGVDLYGGPYINQLGSDGFGDTPYIINAVNQDNYPLMNLWSSTLLNSTETDPPDCGGSAPLLL